MESIVEVMTSERKPHGAAAALPAIAVLPHSANRACVEKGSGDAKINSRSSAKSDRSLAGKNDRSVAAKSDHTLAVKGERSVGRKNDWLVAAKNERSVGWKNLYTSRHNQRRITFPTRAVEYSVRAAWVFSDGAQEMKAQERELVVRDVRFYV